MGRQSFTLKWTAIGGDVLLVISRNHLVSGLPSQHLALNSDCTEDLAFFQAYLKGEVKINCHVNFSIVFGPNFWDDGKSL